MMDKSTFTPLEIAVWAAVYAGHKQREIFPDLAAKAADEAIVQLRRQVIPMEQWGGQKGR